MFRKKYFFPHRTRVDFFCHFFWNRALKKLTHKMIYRIVVICSLKSPRRSRLSRIKKLWHVYFITNEKNEEKKYRNRLSWPFCKRFGKIKTIQSFFRTRKDQSHRWINRPGCVVQKHTLDYKSGGVVVASYAISENQTVWNRKCGRDQLRDQGCRPLWTLSRWKHHSIFLQHEMSNKDRMTLSAQKRPTRTQV